MNLYVKKILAFLISISIVLALLMPPAFSHDKPVIKSTGFSDVYATSFFQRKYITPVMIAGFAVAAGGAAAFTTMTGGAGAPVALMGVGKTAAWIGGNVPGAYMIGLANVGGFFGGNAIVGAAILNGAAAAVVATTGGSIVGVAIAGTAYLVDGFNYLKDQETKELVYLTTLRLLPDTGSVSTRDAVKRIMELESSVMSIGMEVADKEKEIALLKSSFDAEDSSFEKQKEKLEKLALDASDLYLEQKNIVSQLQLLKQSQVEALERILEIGDYRQDDILSLSLIAWNEHRYELFKRAVEALNPKDVSDKSFYHYLRALSAIASDDLDQADRELSKSMLMGSYALEPIILRSILLGEEFAKNEHRLGELAFFARNHFDDDEYVTELKLSSFYFRLASIYFQNEHYEEAKKYFSKAHRELGFFQRDGLISRVGMGNQEMSQLIRVNIANSNYMLGNVAEADELMANITMRMSKQEKVTVMGLYEGSFHD